MACDVGPHRALVDRVRQGVFPIIVLSCVRFWWGRWHEVGLSGKR